MKLHNIFVFDDGKFEYKDICFSKSLLESIVNNPDWKFKFVIVDVYTIYQGGGKPVGKYSRSLVYLGGELVRRYYSHVVTRDIECLKRRLTTLYSVDGKKVYFPDRPFTTDDVMELIGEMFHCYIVKTRPHRMAAIEYAWDAKIVEKEKLINAEASKKFKRDFFGDVLYINENFIS